jgi:hypothetical protein
MLPYKIAGPGYVCSVQSVLVLPKQSRIPLLDFRFEQRPRPRRAIAQQITGQPIGISPMKLLVHGYRFLSNFLFLALVYYSLNFVETYHQRAILAILVLVYAAMRAATALRSFYFFQRIERLEFEARRLSGETAGSTGTRKQVVSDVSSLRRSGEINSYIDLLFLATVVLLCVSKIVTN